MMETPNQNPVQESLRILVVEDSDPLRVMFLHAFPSLYAAYGASNVQDGWKLYLDKNPDIVFLDIGLPDGNGHDLARRIKKRNPSTCIFMATASRYTDDKKEAAFNHVDGFITKPFDKQTIMAYVDWYLNTYRRIPGAN